MTGQAGAIAVKSTASLFTAAGVWTGVIIASLTLIGVIIKVAPRWRELGIGERRGDLDDMRKRIAELESKVETASTAAHAAEMKLVYAVSAIQLLAARIRAEKPDDPALAQAMELLSAATTGSVPSWGGKLAAGLDKIRGVGE